MKQIIEHAIIVLEKAGDFVTEDDLIQNIQSVFPKVKVAPILKALKGTIYIGYDKEKGYKWFDWNEVSEKNKRILILNQKACREW